VIQAIAEAKIPAVRQRRRRSDLRTWSPPGRDVRIEYSEPLLREVRGFVVENDVSGVLFGRLRNGVAVLTAARLASDDPPVGLEPVGIFSARMRGEVFLTESDLQRFEKVESDAAVALVVAGTRAGFFIHESDGSLRSIKSHREISVGGGAVPAKRWAPPVAVFAGAILAIPLLALPAWHPHPPVDLVVRENAGQLRITWNRAAIAGPVDLEIRDGTTRIVTNVSSMLSGATYQPRTDDVEIRLGTESARFIGAPDPKLEPAGSGVAELRLKARKLRTAAAGQRRRIAELEKILSTMDLDH